MSPAVLDQPTLTRSEWSASTPMADSTGDGEGEGNGDQAEELTHEADAPRRHDAPGRKPVPVLAAVRAPRLV